MTANERSEKLTFKEIPVPSVSRMNTLLTSFKAGQFSSPLKILQSQQALRCQ
jgi:hypothetical protein